MPSKQMRLSLFINPTGHHQAAWRHPETDADAGVNFTHYKNLVQGAERAKFDAIFLADNQCVRPGPMDFIGRVAQYVANFEPLTLLSALSSVTEHIGLIATASTSFNFPFQLARKFASLDHLSGGRSGWNIVTSGMEEEAYNFGLDQHLEHDYRYGLAKEFVEICLGLWDSWDDDAFKRDKKSGIFSDTSKLHPLNYKSEHYKVKGPLNVPRPPQGYPLLVQAGSSEAGKTFAAEFAEMMFISPQSADQSRKLTSEMKERAAKVGRDPDHLKIMPGIAPVVGRTEEEAKEKHAYLQSLLTPEVALHFLSMRLGGSDLSKYDLDGPFPEELLQPSATGTQTGISNLKEQIVREPSLTIRSLAMRMAGSLAGLAVHGSATKIADMMEEWFTSGACDGFNVQPAYMPGAFNDFTSLVVPELQRRGLMRTEYEGKTLRDHFGLPRPKSRYQGGKGKPE